MSTRPVLSQGQSIANYQTHRWLGVRQYIPGEPDEVIVACYECGMENAGDPSEFPDLGYPPCGEMSD